MTSTLEDLDGRGAGDVSIKSSKSNNNSNINSAGTDSGASHDVVTESGNGSPIIDCKGDRTGNNSTINAGVGDYDSNDPLLVSTTATTPIDVGVGAHISATPIELAYSSQRPVPQKDTIDLQATGGQQQNRSISIPDSKDIDLESSEGGKVKSNPIANTSFDQVSPSRKYKYNRNDPIVELAIARAIPCDIDSSNEIPYGSKKIDIKQVATPAFEHDYHDKSFCRRYAIIVGGCVVLGIVLIVLLLVVLSNDTAPVYRTDEPSVTKAPTASPTDITRESIVIDYLTAELAPKVLVDGSSYSEAADWFLYQDSQPTGLSVQRYALAVFYFLSTRNGSTPWRSCNPPFLSSSEEPRSSLETNDSAIENTNICTFLELTRSPDGSSIEFKEVPGKIRWLSSFHECEWQGVVCSAENQVQKISVAGHGIQGNFSGLFTGFAGPEEDEDNYLSNSLFRAFPFLQIINLSYNGLTGTLPASFTDFPDLIELELHGNSLSGEIPSSLFDKFTSLQLLNLGENRLSGGLDTKIGQLTNLRGLHLHQNYLRGQFPSEIGKLSSFLTHSRISGNEFSGPLPTEIGRLTHLIDFQYANNLFTGTISTQFGQLTSIDIFRLDDNQLSGTIPVELCNLTNSRAILLERNVLTGPLPTTELLQLKRLIRFHVNNNQLTGPIPSQLGDLPDLQLVWLHLNEFSGSMPTEVCEAASIPNTGISFLQADCEPIENPANPCRCCSACCDRSNGVCLPV